MSDADIKFKKTKDDKCWLQHLNKEMDKHQVIGKLGIALNTKILQKNKILNKILLREKRYQDGNFIGDNVIAPTDTTAAIYRKDLFITGKFKMELGHTSLIKPYYYSCRTKNKLDCIHLGWRKYLKMIKKNYNNNLEIKNKAWFFCKFNRPIEEPLLKQLSFFERFAILFLAKYYFRPLIGVSFLYKWAKYIIVNFPLNYNEIQKKN